MSDSNKNSILKILRDAGGWVSGEAVSAELGVSRAAVSKQISLLRREGKRIESAPRRGYLLVGEEEPFDEAEARRGLETVLVGRGEWHWLRRADSTNRVARSLAEQGAPAGSVVLAEAQSEGRGRRNRPWVTLPGGLSFSLLLRPVVSFASTPLYTLLAAVAVAEAVEEVTGAPARVKWPNDVLVNGRKVCGILQDVGASGGDVVWMVLGIGVNVNAEASEFPESLTRKVTSLSVESGGIVSRAALLRAILTRLDVWLVRLAERPNVVEGSVAGSHGRDALLARWVELCPHMDGEVGVERGDGSHLHGRAVGITRDGGLMVRGEDGTVTELHVGDLLPG